MNRSRIQNLQKIIDERFNSWNKLAIAIGKEASYLNGVKNDKRPFTEKLAREIEYKLNLPHGYLDRGYENHEIIPGTFRTPEYEVKFSLGEGEEIISPDNIVKYHVLDESFLHDFMVKKENLAVVSVIGNSMEPTLRDREKVIIDISRREFIDNKVFAITTKNHAWVKRLRITPNGERWRSDNEEYRQYDDELNNGESTIRLLGLVLYSLGRPVC